MAIISPIHALGTDAGKASSPGSRDPKVLGYCLAERLYTGNHTNFIPALTFSKLRFSYMLPEYGQRGTIKTRSSLRLVNLPSQNRNGFAKVMYLNYISNQ